MNLSPTNNFLAIRYPTTSDSRSSNSVVIPEKIESPSCRITVLQRFCSTRKLAHMFSLLFTMDLCALAILYIVRVTELYYRRFSWGNSWTLHLPQRKSIIEGTLEEGYLCNISYSHVSLFIPPIFTLKCVFRLPFS